MRFFLPITLLVILVACQPVPEATSKPTLVLAQPSSTLTIIPPTLTTLPTSTVTEEFINPTRTSQIILPPTQTEMTHPGLQSNPDGVIYLALFQYPFYAKVELSETSFPKYFYDQQPPPPLQVSESVPPSVVFSPISSQLVYLFKEDDKLSLWKSDLNFENSGFLWRDDLGWMQPDDQSEIFPFDVEIKWGPNDSFLLLSSYALDEKLLIYLLSSHEVIETNGSCSQVAQLPGSLDLAIWCTLDDSATAPYAYFMSDGSFVFTESPPIDGIEVSNWSFSPSGDRLVYSPIGDDIMILSNEGDEIVVPAQVIREIIPYNSESLQWSTDGNSLLVYAFNEEFCGLHENQITGKLEPRDCWLVVDSRNGEFLWGPRKIEEKLESLTGIPLQEHYSPCASLSPDRMWIAFCYHLGAIHYFLLSQINNDPTLLDFGTDEASGAIKWLAK